MGKGKLVLAAAGLAGAGAAVPAGNALAYSRERKAEARLDPAKTARTLNRQRAAPSYRKLGFRSGDDVAGVYLSKNPKVLARNATGMSTVARADPDVRRAADWWSARDANVKRVQHRRRPKDTYNPFQIASGEAKRDVRAYRVSRMIDKAPANAPRLYRGTAMSQRKINTMKPGKTLSLPASSWSDDPRVPEYFATRASSKNLRAKPTTMRLEPKSRALHVAPATRRKMGEWASRGQYEVVGAKDHGDRAVITVREKR